MMGAAELCEDMSVQSVGLLCMSLFLVKLCVYVIYVCTSVNCAWLVTISTGQSMVA